MRIAFYAPMNAPDAGPASGDRSLARLFMRALTELGHDVEVAARSTTYASSPEDQKPLLTKAKEEAIDLVGHIDAGRKQRPDLWFTYHVYYRAPDLVGPLVSNSLSIPYVIAEASDAPKRRSDGWSEAYIAAHDAIAAADRVFAMTDHDRACLSRFVEPERLIDLPPCIDCTRFRAWRGKQREARQALRSSGILLDGSVVITVGMMRHRKKLASYQMLAESLKHLEHQPWTLLVVGDGPARVDVEATFADFDRSRVHFLGARSAEDMPLLYAASDLYLWPGVDEAFGLAYLEAQATGLPAIAQDTRGVPSVVAHGITGVLTPVGDTGAYADAITSLLHNTTRRAELSANAIQRIDARHTLDKTKAILAANLEAIGRSR